MLVSLKLGQLLGTPFSSTLANARRGFGDPVPDGRSSDLFRFGLRLGSFLSLLANPQRVYIWGLLIELSSHLPGLGPQERVFEKKQSESLFFLLFK